MFAEHNKFRAKSKETNKWVYGKKYESICCVNVDLSNTKRINKGVQKTYIFSGFDRKTEVDAKTISQYTGYLDCNKNKIYTGDIISWEPLIWEPYSNLDISDIVVIGEVKNGCQIEINKIIPLNKNVSDLELRVLKKFIEDITDNYLLDYDPNSKIEIIGNIFDDNTVKELQSEKVGQYVPYTQRAHIYSPFDEKFEVDPNTISQYTGYKDIHKNNIYEGDIIKYPRYNGSDFILIG